MHIQSLIITLAALFIHSYSDFLMCLNHERPTHEADSNYLKNSRDCRISLGEDTHLPVPKIGQSLITIQLAANRLQMMITPTCSILPLHSSPLLFCHFLPCFRPTVCHPSPLPVNIDAPAIKFVGYRFITVSSSRRHDHYDISVVKNKHTCACVGVWMNVGVCIFVHPQLHVYEYVCVGLSLRVCHIDETGLEKPKLYSRDSVSSCTFNYVISPLWTSHLNQRKTQEQLRLFFILFIIP